MVNRHEADLRRLGGIVWSLIVLVAVGVFRAPLFSNFRLVWPSFCAAVGTTTACLAIAWFYRTRRPDANLASALTCTAQIVAFAAVGAPLSYLAASIDLPLRDNWFDLADHALGLDWSALLGWMDAHAAIH